MATPTLIPETSDTSSVIDLIKSVGRNIRDDPISWSVIFIITAFFGFFMVVPLIRVIIGAFWVNGSFPGETYANLFSRKTMFDPFLENDTYLFGRDRSNRPEYDVFKLKGPNFGTFLNTIVIGIFTTLLSLILGIITALTMARVDFKGKTLLSGLLLVPLVLPPFVSGIGYRAMLGPNGIINNHVLVPAFGFKILLEGMFAIVFVQSAHYFTLIYLNVYSSLMNADPSLEEAAENMGASRLKILRSVTLPLALPGIASGSILVLILSMEDLGTPAIFAGFGDEVAQKTITYEILTQIRRSIGEREGVPAEVAILSAFLLIVSIIGFMLIRKYVSLRQYSMISKGRAGTFRTAKPGIFGTVFIYVYFIVLLGLALLPHFGIFVASSTSPQIWPLDFTLDHYKELFDFENGFGRFIRNTIVYAGISTIIIVILATFAGYVANRKRFPGQSIFDTMITIPIAIPGVVLGIGYIEMFGGTDVVNFGLFEFTLNPLIYAPTILIISYTIRKFPFTVRSVYAGLQQTDVVLEEAAANMGASKQRTIAGIVIPLIVLNIIAGALISLVYNMSEVSTTLILVNSRNYGTVTWAMDDTNNLLAPLAAMGMFLMALQAFSLLMTSLLLKNRAEAITGI